MKKVVNPFKKFLNNITLGLILVVLAFCAMPILNVNFNSNQDVQAASKTISIKCYGYNGKKDIGISEVDRPKDGFLGITGDEYYKYNGTQMGFGTTANNDNIARPNKTYTSSSVIYCNLYTSGKAQVIGYFSGRDFTTSQLLSLGSVLDMNKVNNGATVYCLLSLPSSDYNEKKTGISVTTTPYLNVGYNIWESTYAGNFTATHSSIKVGEQIVFYRDYPSNFNFNI